MCIYDYKFSFGSKKFEVKIDASNIAEANIKFKDFLFDTISVNSLDIIQNQNNKKIKLNNLEEIYQKKLLSYQ